MVEQHFKKHLPPHLSDFTKEGLCGPVTACFHVEKAENKHNMQTSESILNELSNYSTEIQLNEN